MSRRGSAPSGRLAPHGVKDASTDEAIVRAWWTDTPDANVGLATGAASGLFVVDVDGAVGSDSLGLLLLENGPPAEGPQHDGACVRTGSGWHLYFALPPAGARVPNSAGRIAPGLDLRGDGGYVIASPSRHVSRVRYVWIDPPRDEGLPTPRPWLLDLAAPPRPTATNAPAPLKVRPTGASSYGRAAAIAELEELAQAQEGQRNDALNRAAFSLGQLVAGGELSADGTRTALMEVATAIGLRRHEAELTIESGLRAGGNWPRIAPTEAAA